MNQTQRTNTVWLHLYEVSRLVEFLETENGLLIPNVVTWGWGNREWGVSI